MPQYFFMYLILLIYHEKHPFFPCNPGRRFVTFIKMKLQMVHAVTSDFIITCQKTHKLACGMNGTLIEPGFLGDGESPNNRLPSRPTGGISPPGGLDYAVGIDRPRAV